MKALMRESTSESLKIREVTRANEVVHSITTCSAKRTKRRSSSSSIRKLSSNQHALAWKWWTIIFVRTSMSSAGTPITHPKKSPSRVTIATRSSTRPTTSSGQWSRIGLSWTVSTTGRLLLTHALSMNLKLGLPLSRSLALRTLSATMISALASTDLGSWGMGAMPRVASTASHSRRRASWGCSSTWIKALCHSLWMASSLDWPFRTMLCGGAPSGQLSHCCTQVAAPSYLVFRNQHVSMCDYRWDVYQAGMVWSDFIT